MPPHAMHRAPGTHRTRRGPQPHTHAQRGEPHPRVDAPRRYRYARSTRTKGKKRKGDLNTEQAVTLPPTCSPHPPPTAPPPPHSHVFPATPVRQGGSSSAPPEALSLHALALAGASLASPPSGPAPPPGSFKTCSFKPFGPQSSPAPGARATVQRGAVSPVSSELSMLDQLCVVADGARPTSPCRIVTRCAYQCVPTDAHPHHVQACRGAEADARRQLHRAGLSCASVDEAARRAGSIPWEVSCGDPCCA